MFCLEVPKLSAKSWHWWEASFSCVALFITGAVVYEFGCDPYPWFMDADEALLGARGPAYPAG